MDDRDGAGSGSGPDPAGRNDATLPPAITPQAPSDLADGPGPGAEAPAPNDAAWLPEPFDAVGPPLGAGATAVVWPVRHRLDGREFALKVWRRPLNGTAEHERFRREVRQWVALNEVSGHIVTYTWAEENPPGGLPWIGMERHGQSVQHVAEQRRHSLTDRLIFSMDLLAGLTAMHQRGLLHRDVKPANLVTDTNGRAKLCDLGLALESAAMTQDNAAGTPRYLAPELRDGRVTPSTRTDVYSAAQTIRDILGPDMPEPFEQLLTEAGSINPDDRPADASAFATQFRQVADELGYRLPQPLPAPGRGAPASSAVLQRGGLVRRRRLITAGVIVLILVAVGAVVRRPWTTISDKAASQDTSASPTVPPQWPDANRASNDITADGQPIVLPTTEAGRCEVVVEGAKKADPQPYVVDGVEVAQIWTYVSESAGQACAKLVKQDSSPYVGVRTHMALTLCGDGNSCDFDWNSYSVDAGPVVVPSRAGCISWRVSMMDETGTRWLIRDDVQWSGCPTQ